MYPAVQLILLLTSSLLAAGTNLQYSQCPKDGSGGTTNCMAAFMGLHLTPASSAYLEVNTLMLSLSSNTSLIVDWYIFLNIVGYMGLACRPRPGRFPATQCHSLFRTRNFIRIRGASLDDWDWYAYHC